MIQAVLILWGALAVIALALLIYRTSLTRDEDDQIYLDDAFQHEKAAQEAIVAKVGKIEQPLRYTLWAVGAVTAILAIYYVWDLLHEFLQ
jgi:hypothetical protein